MLWFDVGIKRYTTKRRPLVLSAGLWFDVGIKRYTTHVKSMREALQLWFDVGIKRYTTPQRIKTFQKSCGLM